MDVNKIGKAFMYYADTDLSSDVNDDFLDPDFRFSVRKMVNLMAS